MLSRLFVSVRVCYNNICIPNNKESNPNKEFNPNRNNYEEKIAIKYYCYFTLPR